MDPINVPQKTVGDLFKASEANAIVGKINELVSGLNSSDGEIDQTQASLVTLQGLLTDLQSALATESNTRSAADIVLQNNINALSSQISSAMSGYRGKLAIADTPTQDGFYLASQSGTYTNAGNIVVDLTQGITLISKTGSNYTKVLIPIDLTAYATKAEFDPVKLIADTLAASIKIDNVGRLNFSDQNGNIGAYIDSDGTVVTNHLKSMLSIPDITQLGQHEIRTNDNYSLLIRDPNGWIGYAVGLDGTVLQVSDNDNNVVEDEISYPNIPTDAILKIVYGQSLSVGFPTTPTTLTTEPKVYTLVGGPFIQTLDDSAYASNRLSTEVTYETPCDGYMRMYIQSLYDNNVFPSSPDYVFDVMSYAPGQGSTAISGLRKGTAPYDKLYKGMQATKNNFDAAGKTTSMSSFFWLQGEQNMIDGTSRSSYASSMALLRSEIDTDAKAIFKQKNDVKMLTYQTASLKTLGTAVPFAQLDKSLEDGSNIHLAVVMYPYDYGDSLHLANAEQYIMVGALAGYIDYQINVMGVDWKPIHIISNEISGNFVNLKFHVPVKPLVIDTTIVNTIANSGFRLFDLNNTEVTISSVQITRQDTVKITCAVPVLSGFRLTYAVNGSTTQSGRTNGPRGNLRDSQGNTVKYKPATLNYPLHNWTPIFEYYIL